MLFKQFKAAQVFKLALPQALDIEHLVEASASAQDEDIGQTEFSRANFAPNPVTGRYITPLERGYTFRIRYQEKVMPASAIRREVEKKVREIEEQEGRHVGRKERAEIKDSVMFEMVVRAPVAEKSIYAFYDWQEKNLFVTSTNETDGQIVCRLLCAVVGQVTSSTVHIHDQTKGLATRLANYLNGDGTAFSPFHLGEQLKLKGGMDTSQSVTFKGVGFSCGHDEYELVSQLSSGATVEEVELSTGTLTFVLDKKFRIKRIRDDAERDEQDDMDVAEAWVSEADAMMIQASSIVAHLCQMFEFTPVVSEPEPVTVQQGLPLDPGDAAEPEDDDDPLYHQAVDFVIESQRPLISSLQRHFRIGYNRAAWLIERMQDEGIVSEANEDGTREVLKVATA